MEKSLQERPGHRGRVFVTHPRTFLAILKTGQVPPAAAQIVVRPLLATFVPRCDEELMKDVGSFVWYADGATIAHALDECYKECCCRRAAFPLPPHRLSIFRALLRKREPGTASASALHLLSLCWVTTREEEVPGDVKRQLETLMKECEASAAGVSSIGGALRASCAAARSIGGGKGKKWWWSIGCVMGVLLSSGKVGSDALMETISDCNDVADVTTFVNLLSTCGIGSPAIYGHALLRVTAIVANTTERVHLYCADILEAVPPPSPESVKGAFRSLAASAPSSTLTSSMALAEILFRWERMNGYPNLRSPEMHRHVVEYIANVGMMRRRDGMDAMLDLLQEEWVVRAVVRLASETDIADHLCAPTAVGVFRPRDNPCQEDYKRSNALKILFEAGLPTPRAGLDGRTTALRRAAECGFPRVVRELLRVAASRKEDDVGLGEEGLLYHAATNAVLRELVRGGAPIPPLGTILMKVIKTGDQETETLRLLLETAAGQSLVDIADEGGDFPLSTVQEASSVPLLIRAGASVNMRNARGHTALLAQAYSDRYEVVRALLRAPGIELPGTPADEKAAMSNNVKMLLVVHGMSSRGWGLSEGMWPSDLDTLVFLEKVRRVSECQSATTPQTKAKAKGTFNIRDKMRVVVEAGGGAEAGDGMAVGELVCRRLNEDQWRLLQELMVGEKRHLYADSYMFHSGLG